MKSLHYIASCGPTQHPRSITKQLTTKNRPKKLSSRRFSYVTVEVGLSQAASLNTSEVEVDEKFELKIVCWPLVLKLP